MRDVIVVGGGVIGLSVAHAVAAEGQSVLVLDPGEPSKASSWAAAGMLAPQSEAETPGSLFTLCIASLRIYRDWAAQIMEQSGVDPEYAEPGLLCVASTEQSLCALKNRLAWQRDAGFESEFLTPEEVRRVEPNLTLPIAGGIHMPGECRVTPRLLLEALRKACLFRGVEIRTGERVCAVLKNGERVAGVQTERESFATNSLVIASGARTSEISGLLRVPIVPRKGQIFSLRSPRPVFQKLIRWEHAYAVQRQGGDLVIGATNEDAGFDRSLTPAGIGGLMAKAQQLSESVASLPIQEMWTGLRPATPDGLPVIGASGLDGLVYATGHYRNGILLAPITASIVASLLGKRKPPLPLEPYAAARFEV